MDFSDPNIIIGLGVLGFLVVGAVIMLWEDDGSEVIKRRATEVSSASQKIDTNDPRAMIRQRNKQLVDALRDEGVDRRSVMMDKNLETLLERTGKNITPQMFWGGSVGIGAAMAFMVVLSGFNGAEVIGIPFLTNPVLALMIGFIGFYSIPRAIINKMATKRHKIMTNQFAEAIDMIVRGVKSGLPLNDCFRLIAKEGPMPIAEEFRLIQDDMKMGNTIERTMSGFFKRVPLPEINFFVIVITIQQKSGGNLSEALTNLSDVIRERKQMRETIKALASEAIASASIVGALPLVVGGLVYLTSPDYIMYLFTHNTGNFALLCAALMMSMGIFVLRRMMNFEI